MRGIVEFSIVFFVGIFFWVSIFGSEKLLYCTDQVYE
jgi:hypothetical protein